MGSEGVLPASGGRLAVLYPERASTDVLGHEDTGGNVNAVLDKHFVRPVISF